MSTSSLIVVAAVYAVATPLFWIWLNRIGAKSPQEKNDNLFQHDADENEKEN